MYINHLCINSLFIPYVKVYCCKECSYELQGQILCCKANISPAVQETTFLTARGPFYVVKTLVDTV